MGMFFNVIIGIFLGLDAFSLLVSLSSFKIANKDANILILIIGVFHLTFPILGSVLGSFIHLPINELKIIIFFFLMIEMTLDYFNHQKLVFISSIISIIILAFSVSIDSFSIGVGLPLRANILTSCIIYSICAITFSYFGYALGKYLNNSIGRYANIIGIMLIILVLVCQIMRA